MLNIAKATAKMVFNEGSSSYLCTGTLINSVFRETIFIPLRIASARRLPPQHSIPTGFRRCVMRQALRPRRHQLLTGGADLMMTEPTMDGTLLRLRLAPPTGSVRAGLECVGDSTGTTVVGIHHPERRPARNFSGQYAGLRARTANLWQHTAPQANKDSFITVRWTNGTTEGGSSGSGVFTYNPAGVPMNCARS